MSDKKPTANDVKESLKKVAAPVEEAKITAKEQVNQIKGFIKTAKTLLKDIGKWNSNQITDDDTDPKIERILDSIGGFEDDLRIVFKDLAKRI